ncbi:MAG: GxxExxY protein [Verrucomicrobiota bacterium]|nr:GxxExxY protein [Verrucomicrobiota bacterium]
MTGNLLHEEITKLVIGAGMDVFNSVGPGWDEWDYHRSMLKALADRGVKAESHLRGSLMHRGECVDRFELDIMVEGKVILELKHIREGFAPEHYVQLIGYLKFWKKDLGLLMNFGGDRLYFKRVPYTPRKGEIGIAGKWDDLQRVCPELLNLFKEACSCILTEHGLGYSRSTSEKLLLCELKHLGVRIENPVVDLVYGELKLGECSSDSVVADSRLVLKASALPENTSAVDFARLQSCMAQVDIPLGVLVNFGRTVLLLRAIKMR